MVSHQIGNINKETDYKVLNRNLELNSTIITMKNWKLLKHI